MKSTTDFSFRATLQNYYAAICESMGESGPSPQYPTVYDALNTLACKLNKYAYSDEVNEDFGLEAT